jgi:hypothetical protein
MTASSRRGRSFPPSVRRVDPRYLRTGAALSAAVLVVAALLGVAWPVAIDAVLLGVSAVFGTKRWLLQRPWAPIRTWLKAPPAKIVPEVPFRFSQAGAAALLAVGVVLVAAGAGAAGWAIVLVVAAAQAVHAALGVSAGVLLYGAPWPGPAVFTSLVVPATGDPESRGR